MLYIYKIINRKLKNRTMRNRKIEVFYRPEQVCKDNIKESSYSKSPLKPMLLMEYLKKNNLNQYLNFNSDFRPLTRREIRLAHTKKYVKNFFAGKGNCGSNSIPWSKNLVESVTYTNSSLYHAVEAANANPRAITFSPTSGFHHAHPGSGSGFCTFSGQVITATKLYRDKGLRGAFLDLDGHFGNSIEDARGFVNDLDESIRFNINPKGSHKVYIADLKKNLAALEMAFLQDEVDYVVWCHGADSHEWDQLGHQCSTAEWILCSKLFYSWVRMMEENHGIVVPVTLSLFGGYRDDDYDSVLSLHTGDIQQCLEILCDNNVEYVVDVKPRANHYGVKNWWSSNDVEEKELTQEEEDWKSFEDKWSDDEPSTEEILQGCTAKEIIDMCEGHFNVKITTSLKNKKQIVKQAAELFNTEAAQIETA